ncbi:MAG: phosphotransferase [Arenicella sp.]|nr:phosphotransferase [Arenicella sp.]
MKTVEVSAQEELDLIKCIEEMIGGKVVSIARQPRWRPSWFVTVEKNKPDQKDQHGDNKDELIELYVRGDRQSEVMPFPDLKREADILTVLQQQGIPAPTIYGMCESPQAIIMQASPGSRDVSTADTAEQGKDIARQYIQALADMHSLPLQQFADIGIRVPEGAEEIALVGLEAYLPLYKKQKTQPDPLIEFAMRWLRSNAPKHRESASFIAFDAGQFLFENGKITALYDFEFAMIGDPMADLATMAMRQSVEPMGEEIGILCDYYGQITGQPVDKKIVRYHHALFATVACMQFAGALSNPQPGDPHDIYLEWTLALRRSLLLVLADCMTVELAPPEALTTAKSHNAAALTMLVDTVSRFKVDTEQQQGVARASTRLLEYLQRLDQYGEQLEQLAIEDAEIFIGRTDGKDDMNQKLEAFVQQAEQSNNAALLQFFYSQIERQLMAFTDTGVGFSASHIRLEQL